MTDTQSPPSSEGLGEFSNAPKVLARNSACHQCRKRKLKCDAIRPVCTNCTKPRPRAGGHEDCSWDEKKDPGTTRSRRKKEVGDEASAKRARLNELEERVAAFEKVLQLQNQRGPPPTSDEEITHTQGLNNAIPPGGGIAGQQARVNEPINQWDAALSAFPPVDLTSEVPSAGWTPTSSFKQSNGPSPDISFPGVTSINSFDGIGNFSFPNLQGVDREKEDLSNDGMDLAWPDWPQDLPSLEVVEHVTSVFFDKVPTVPKMLHRATFLNNLHLPPAHHNFPAWTLLHAILAVTAPHLPITELAKRKYFPSGASFHDITHPEQDLDAPNGSYRHLSSSFHATAKSAPGAVTPLGRFQMWHRRKTFQALAKEFDSGERLLQALQAQIIVTTVDAYNAWWTDVWMESGSCMRMATPLRINESPNVPDDVLPRFKHVLIPDATTPLEQAIRDRTWWMAYLVERSVNMSTTWPESLADEEITVELPVIQSNFDMGVGDLQGVQTLHSPNFFSAHPPQHCDGFVFYIKALKLWTDITRWFRKYCRGRHTVSGYLGDSHLRLFLSQINAFRLTFPSHLRKPTPGAAYGQSSVKSMDVDLVASIMLTHGATLTLGEPLITKDMHTSDVAKMALSAIRAVLSLLYDITSTSFDLSLLPFSCSFVWCLCARGLCRFIDAAEMNGDRISSSVFRSELEVFRLAMSQHGERYPVANRHLKMVDEVIKLQSENNVNFSSGHFDMNCTKDQIFDPDFTPFAEASVRTSGSPSSGPSAATPPTTITIRPSGVHRGLRETKANYTVEGVSGKGQAPNPSREFWIDRIPSAEEPNPDTKLFSERYWADKFWNDFRQLNQSDGNQSGVFQPAQTGPQQQQAPIQQRPQQAQQTAQQPQPQPQQSQQPQQFSYGSGSGQATIVPELNIDVESWFDISSFSFDVDALNALATTVDPNATFHGTEYSFKM